MLFSNILSSWKAAVLCRSFVSSTNNVVSNVAANCHTVSAGCILPCAPADLVTLTLKVYSSLKSKAGKYFIEVIEFVS